MNLFQWLINKMFGCEYAALSWGWSSVVRRVRFSESGPFVKVYGEIVFLKETSRTVRPLTFKL